MLYEILKFIVRIALRVFFKHLTVKNLERIPSEGPLIVVANHPNTFMDPMAIACFMKQQVHFLTNGSVFNTPFKRWILRQMNMVPIYRKQDVQDGEKADNTEVFKQCYEFLEKGGTLMIFPEGISLIERRLRPLKTGTARIALGAAAAQNFDSKLKLVSVGLNYSEANRFRSELLISVDEPIEVKEWQEAYEQDEHKAIKSLTATLEKGLKEHTIVTSHDDEDQLSQEIASVYTHRLQPTDEELPKAEERYQISRHAVEALHYFQKHDPELAESLSIRVRQYSNLLRRLHLKGSLLEATAHKGLFYEALTEFLLLFLGFPVYLFGLLHHYLPYLLPAKVAQSVTKEVEYHAPIMLVVGVFTFGMAYALYFIGFSFFAPPWWAYLAYAIVLPASGFFCFYYWSRWLQARQQLWLFSLFYRRSSLVAQLLRQREQLITDLNQAKDEYFQSLDD